MRIVMKTDRHECSYRLEAHGVKPTPNRMLVYCAMKRAQKALSLGELENVLETIDKSSISRVLNLFQKSHLLHAVEDGEGISKYELCDAEVECSVNDMHPHFYCEKCHRLICIKSEHIPVVDLGEGYVVNSINYMVKGICPDCSNKK